MNKTHTKYLEKYNTGNGGGGVGWGAWEFQL